MAEYEEKFIVINKKHLRKLSNTNSDSKAAVKRFLNELSNIASLCEDIKINKYYICNQDEFYAHDVLRVILQGEDFKDHTDKY